MSAAPHPAIRPGIETLRHLPTLRRENRRINGLEGVLELKLESDERRYWVCASSSTAARPDAIPEEFRVDFITMEVYNPETDGWDAVAYGPEKTKELQLVDYFEVLGRRLDELLARELPDSPEETRRELSDLHTEFLALRKLLSLEPGKRSTPMAAAAARGR
jgi:hypothetical protein